MTAIAVLGAQWGDEGKGKVAHLFSQGADFCVRFNGGTNAGHRVIFTKVKVSTAERRGGAVTEEGEFKFHLVPSGALHEHCIGVLGNGMVIDPRALVTEIEALRSIKDEEPQLFISPRAHLLLPYHPIIEELAGAASEIGTTSKGIGPAYGDKIQRRGITMADLLFEGAFREKLRRNLEREKRLWGGHPSLVKLNADALADEILGLFEAAALPLGKRIIDTVKLLNFALDEGKRVIFEGAQGCLLDIDFGTYPYVTSSSATIGGIGIGAGVSPRRIEKVIGVTKAYTTRVGSGPFPTEVKDSMGEQLRQAGREFGTTTGRPRRCGWLDLVALKYASQVNGFTELAVMKLDVLSEFPEIPVAMSYRYQGECLEDFPMLPILERCEPVYEKLPGWQEDISHCREFSELPINAQRYIRFIEEQLEVPVALISVGPASADNIFP